MNFHECVCVFARACFYICVRMCARACLCVYILGALCLYMIIYKHTRGVCVCLYMCVCMSVSSCVCICMCVSSYVCICVCACVYIYIIKEKCSVQRYKEIQFLMILTCRSWLLKIKVISYVYLHQKMFEYVYKFDD